MRDRQNAIEKPQDESVKELLTKMLKRTQLRIVDVENRKKIDIDTHNRDLQQLHKDQERLNKMIERLNKKIERF